MGCVRIVLGTAPWFSAVVCAGPIQTCRYLDSFLETVESLRGIRPLFDVGALIAARSRAGRDVHRNGAATQRPVSEVGKAMAWRAPWNVHSRKFDLFDFSSVTIAWPVSYLLEGHLASREIAARASNKRSRGGLDAKRTFAALIVPDRD